MLPNTQRGVHMFHIGKIVEVISQAKDRKIKSADAKVQAVLSMWDENLIILEVDKKIAGAVSSGDYVLADYSPVSEESPYRRMVITKVLSYEKGKKIWDEFKKEFTRKRSSAPHAQSNMPYR